MALATVFRRTDDPDTGWAARLTLTTRILMVNIFALAVLADPVRVLLDRQVDLALVGARLVSVVLEGFSGVLLYLVFGIGRSRASLGASVTAGVIGLACTVLLIPVLREFALPAGQSIGMAVRVVLGLRFLTPSFTSRRDAPSAG